MAERSARLAGRIGLVVLGLGVPGAAGARYGYWIAAHPVASVCLAAGYPFAGIPAPPASAGCSA